MPDYPIGYEPIGTVALLTNPRSGYGSARHATERALSHFNKRGVESVAFTAMTAEDNGRLIRQALDDDDFDAIVVCGGDGMINSALQETADTGIPLGIIPAGSGNDTARHFRIPMDPGAAAEVIADGFVTTTDLGRVSDDNGQSKWFATLLGCATDAYASRRADSLTWAKGPNKFTLAIAREIIRPTTHTYRFELEGVRPIPFLSDAENARRIARDGEIPDDGRVVIERQVGMATFGNTRCFGGGRAVCPRADHRDGMLDFTIAELCNPLMYVRYFNDFGSGNHADVPFVTSYRCRRARVECPAMRTAAHGDGEPLMRVPFTVEAVEAAGRYIVPAP
ncbi:diacylglycerol kinase family protein [Corynebacterium mendelii]|uniref:Diacylglycerol kinase n=1 Tax=Corynebacterium mendelii TaxID=2765362 RepID=A0A939IXL9_9CORY|nr:diacylglycerol kinase family protein [Corynebacterium mendelii]MBN9644198.1 diacylglycerol kinase [Corynebacterium mendelii]